MSSSTLSELAQRFWEWRSHQQPRSHDDIPRLYRPKHWIPRWSSRDVEKYLQDVSNFESELHTLKHNASGFDREDLIDVKLLESACARVRWEIEFLEIWRRFPRFYIDQTIGVIFDLLLPPNPTSQIIDEIRNLLSHFPIILEDAKKNLDRYAYREFAEISIKDLANIENQMKEMCDALIQNISIQDADKFRIEVSKGATSLAQFRDWLSVHVSGFNSARTVGRKNFEWFLSHVAFIPYSIEELIHIGEIEFDRATYLETIYINKYKDVRLPELPKDAKTQSENEKKLELEVRKFYEDESLLTQPPTLKHYLNAPRPTYLEPIRWLGVTDDLTGPKRVHENGVSYVPTPHVDMPYFYAANARDPRAGIVHEGAHYQQLAISWRHPREIRRHYFDSGVNEGLAFYNEEMLLAAGLFDDAPHSQTLMFNFMKLRALRAIIDVSLVTGRMSIEEATDYLSKKVPMDIETAREEAIFFASFPGQGMTYQIGKTQIISLLADSRRLLKEKFTLRHFHDFLWLNGNVPLSLLRWSYLDDYSEVSRATRQSDDDAKAEIWHNVRHMLDSFLAKDRANADRHIHTDVTLWDSVEAPLIFGLQGLNDLRDRRPTTESGPVVKRIENVNPTIDIFGDFAIARYELLVHFEGDIPLEHIRNSAVWRRFENGWKVIHNHEDVIS